jgi:hypothetical protein
LSLGALNGQTLELAEAQAVLEVCEWRKSALLTEKHTTRPAPNPSWAMNGLELVRQRAYMLGGWDASGSVSMQHGLTMLDFETESERIRRMADEFASKLELEQRVADEKAKFNCFLSAAELRIRKERELVREADERRRMHIQDILSALPPLSKPNPVEFVQSNEHTIWVRWDRVSTKANGGSVDPHDVTYMLYAKSEFQPLIRGDRVLVIPLAAAIKAEELRKDKMHTSRTRTSSKLSDHSVSSRNENWKVLEAAHGADDVKMFPGELLDNG